MLMLFLGLANIRSEESGCFEWENDGQKQ